MIRPVNAEQRAERAAANEGRPTLEFSRGTPYDDYVGTEVLHGLQNTVTGLPEERAFLVTTQVMELYFGLLCAEWTLAQEQLDAGDAAAAVTTLRRSSRHVEALNAAWASLSWLTPRQFNAFRDALGEASGFQSAKYRQVEFLLGEKSEAMLRPHRRSPAYPELLAAFEGPSLYDSAAALLEREGFTGPQAWVAIHAADRPDLHELAEALLDLATGFADWRHRHVMSVRRSMGAKPGSGGSNGLRFLEENLRREIFPALWQARTHL
ncbi:tryptophan 2,3-dioxygenase family protein [Nonomuraea sp. NPDC050310]|uniref:tryptophan 2,3-dioxygenase n=1 Tax=Nonomuraea sp. NPDC050310 TaxID=3154935 RepID=UPI0033CCD597